MTMWLLLSLRNLVALQRDTEDWSTEVQYGQSAMKVINVKLNGVLSWSALFCVVDRVTVICSARYVHAAFLWYQVCHAHWQTVNVELPVRVPASRSGISRHRDKPV